MAEARLFDPRRLVLTRASAEFADLRLERAFRTWLWPETVALFRVGTAFILLYNVVFLYVDYAFVGWSPAFAAWVVIRAIVTVLVLRLAWATWAPRDTRRLARRYVEGMIAVPLTISIVVYTRPPDFTIYSIIHIAVIFGVYLMTPFRLYWIAVILLTSTVLELANRLIFGTLPGLFVGALAMAFATTHLVGYIVARRGNGVRRREFANRLGERQARRALEAKIIENARITSDLSAARIAADAANLAKSSFLAVMSHEIRTPLNGILGFAQVLGRTPLNDEQRRHVATIMRSGQNLSRLLSDILDLSRVEAGRIDIAAEPFDVMETLTQVVTLARTRAHAQETVLHLADGQTPPLVLGDSARLTQIATNLVDNAIKYAPGGAIEIALLAKRHDQAVALTINVVDRGPGVPDSLKDAIFDPYVSGDRAVQSSIGLGLAVARRLAEAMGGSLTVSDRPGGGAVFTLTLTLPIASDVVRARPVVGRPAARALNVLLVDDDDINTLLVATLLAKAGHHVTTASDGRQGVEAAARATFDVILMDMRMPVMDGLEAITHIRAARPQNCPPILAMTANVMTHEIESYRAAGAIDVLAKPLDLAGLEARLAALTIAR